MVDSKEIAKSDHDEFLEANAVRESPASILWESTAQALV